MWPHDPISLFVSNVLHLRWKNYVVVGSNSCNGKTLKWNCVRGRKNAPIVPIANMKVLVFCMEEFLGTAHKNCAYSYIAIICTALVESNHLKSIYNIWSWIRIYCEKWLFGGGGIPPLSAKLFWAQWLSVKGGGYPPISLRKKSAKNSYFWPKNAYFRQKIFFWGGGFAKIR